MEYILALDQGTTSSRAIVFDKCGRIAGMAQQEFAQIYPFNGWVEHDPKDILGSQIGVIPEALIRAGVSIDEISAIGITNQRETVFVWDKISGKPICNAIVWQCRRTAQLCERLKSDGLSDFIYEKTGLVPDAYFSATKLKWILDNVRGARDRAERGELLFGTVDTFLMWHLSKGKIFATDYTNASRTMLFNIHTLTWDDELLRLFGVPRVMLPEVYPSGHDYGVTAKSLLGESVPVLSVAGDQQAALFGHLCVESGSLKNTYGTGCFALANTGDKPVRSAHGLITTLAAGRDEKPQYALEGSVFVGGAVVKWLRDELRMIKNAEETEAYARRRPRHPGGVYVVPAFVGLGAPYWDSDARGTVVGLTRGTTKEHFVRAWPRKHSLRGVRHNRRNGKGHRKKSRACGCGRRSERKRFSHAISVRPARQKNLPPLCDGNHRAWRGISCGTYLRLVERRFGHTPQRKLRQGVRAGYARRKKKRAACGLEERRKKIETIKQV